MTTITIPLNDKLNDYIDEQVRLGKASSKAELVRKAIAKYREDELVKAVLEAEQEIRDGKVFTGDLDELVKKLD